MAVNLLPRTTTKRRIQQREIAELAGVSISTVSRVLNNVAGISSELQQRVNAAAAELGRALQELDYRIPEDISITGYDDLSITAFLTPPLTTVRIEREELGMLAVRRLIDHAEIPNLTPMRVELATRLIERRSVARRAAASD